LEYQFTLVGVPVGRAPVYLMTPFKSKLEFFSSSLVLSLNKNLMRSTLLNGVS